MKFDFMIEPWAHQLKEFHASKDLEAHALHWQMRTGKTKVVIDTAMYLYIENKIDVVLVITRSGVHSNWVRKEIPKHCSIPYDAEWWDTDRIGKVSYLERLREVLRCESLIFVAINNESFIKPRAKQYIRRLLKMRVMLVIDEVHDFGSPSSKRFKAARALAKHCSYRRTMTGTNNGNSPLRNWAQFEILQERALGYKNYTPFKKRYGIIEWQRKKNGRMYEDITGYQNLVELQAAIDTLSSTITRKDCPDLPPLIASAFDVRITAIQRHAYRTLKRKFKIALEDGSIFTAAEASVRRLKLQQVLSNFIKDEKGVVHTIDQTNNPRMDALMVQLEDADGKVIIWCRFKQDIANVAQRLIAEGIGFVEYHGDVAKADRFKAEARFRYNPTCLVFLGQPQSAGLGLDLSTADTIVWYSHTDDIVIRDQANERATEKGSSSVAVIDLIVPDSVDEDILDNLGGKRAINEFMNEARTDWRQCALASLERDTI
ncbi:MAG: DEAD/DEAH box helicase [Dehalococcoidales bacterium]